jgi:hypothetical protein
MLIRMVRRKRDAPVIIEVFLDYSTHEKFRDYLAKNNLDESNALVNVLERGMANYWLQYFKQLKQNYQPMKKVFEEYRKDNEALKALVQQNKQLRKILEEKSAEENSIHQSKNMR